MIIFNNEEGGEIGSRLFAQLKFFGRDAEKHLIEATRFYRNQLIDWIKEFDVLILTLGNARVLHLASSGKVVCNGSGVHEDEMVYRMLNPQDVYQDLICINETLLGLRDGKPFQGYLTISPQRYAYPIKGIDPFVDNCLNKSILRCGVDNFVSNHSSWIYFPAFEIVQDELRLYETLVNYDYRHVRFDTTVPYVAKRFLESACVDEILEILPFIEQFPSQKELINSWLKQGLDSTSNKITKQLVNFLSLYMEINCRNSKLDDSVMQYCKEIAREDIPITLKFSVEVPSGTY